MYEAILDYSKKDVTIEYEKDNKIKLSELIKKNLIIEVTITYKNDTNVYEYNDIIDNQIINDIKFKFRNMNEVIPYLKQQTNNFIPVTMKKIL